MIDLDGSNETTPDFLQWLISLYGLPDISPAKIGEFNQKMANYLAAAARHKRAQIAIQGDDCANRIGAEQSGGHLRVGELAGQCVRIQHGRAQSGAGAGEGSLAKWERSGVRVGAEAGAKSAKTGAEAGPI